MYVYYIHLFFKLEGPSGPFLFFGGPQKKLGVKFPAAKNLSVRDLPFWKGVLYSGRIDNWAKTLQS